MKKILLLFLLAPFILFSSDSNIQITDYLGNKSVFKTPAKKHIFLSFCEMVPMLDIWQDTVGYSQHVYQTPLLRQSNPNIDSIPKVGGGSGSNLNIEVLKQLNPDLVVVWAGKKDEINFIKNNGINILAFYPNNIKEVFLDMQSISTALGKEDEFLAKQQEAFKILDLVDKKTNEINHKKTAIYLWNKPNKIAGNGGMVGDMLNRIGVINLGGDIQTDSAEVSIEHIIKLNPEIIFIWGAANFSVEDILNNPKFKSIKAIKNKAVYKMPLWDNWGPRIVETTLFSASKAYAENYLDVDVDKLIGDLNKTLFGIDVR